MEHLLLLKTLGNFWKKLQLFIPTSGHTVNHQCRVALLTLNYPIHSTYYFFYRFPDNNNHDDDANNSRNIINNIVQWRHRDRVLNGVGQVGDHVARRPRRWSHCPGRSLRRRTRMLPPQDVQQSRWVKVKQKNWAVVVAQLVERPPPTTEIRGLNPVIGKLLSNICLL